MIRILSVLENVIKPLHPWGLPRNVDIEITNICQLQCDMCPREGFKDERKIGKMSMEEFHYVLSELKGIPFLSFSGNGEATLHPQFMEFFRMAQKSGKRLTISTNGLTFTRFSEEELIELVNGFWAIDISIDSPYKEKYETIRKGASFDELLRGIRKLVKVKDGGKVVITIHLVYRDQGKKEMEDMIELVNELGLKKITVGKLMYYQGSRVKAKKAITAGDIRGLKKLAGKKGIEIVFCFYKNFSLNKRLVGCNWPWRFIFISYEEIVTPCVSAKDPTRINLGNIFEESFRDIWQGERYRELRKNIRRGHFPTICQEVKCWYVDRGC